MPSGNSHSDASDSDLPEFIRPRKRPTQERAQQTVDAILAAAARILVRDGAGFTTNQVAELAGTSVGSLYQYFPNKDSIVAALLQRQAEAEAAFVLQRMTELRPASLREAITGVIQAVFAFRAQAPQLQAALLEQMQRIPQFPALGEAAAQAAAGLLELVRAFRADIRHEDMNLALYIVGNAAFSITHRGVFPRPAQYDDAIIQEHLTDLLLSYLTHSSGK